MEPLTLHYIPNPLTRRFTSYFRYYCPYCEITYQIYSHDYLQSTGTTTVLTTTLHTKSTNKTICKPIAQLMSLLGINIKYTTHAYLQSTSTTIVLTKALHITSTHKTIYKLLALDWSYYCIANHIRSQYFLQTTGTSVLPLLPNIYSQEFAPPTGPRRDKTCLQVSIHSPQLVTDYLEN